jgi:hypothetical protein
VAIAFGDLKNLGPQEMECDREINNWEPKADSKDVAKYLFFRDKRLPNE